MRRYVVLILFILSLLSACAPDAVQGYLEYDGESSYEMPASGGNIRFNLIWDHVEWMVTEGTADESFVSIAPSSGGSVDRFGNTYVTLTVGRNTSLNPREAVVTISPTRGNVPEMAVMVTVSQEAGLPEEEEKEEEPVVPVRVTVDPSVEYQTIDGFGGMNLLSNWGKTQLMTDDEVDLVFGTDAGGLGLSIMRIRLHPEIARWNIAVPSAKRAYEKYGVKILASPWSPPASMKSNGNVIKGYLKPEKYEDYALYLEKFASYMKDSGAPLYAVSIQNEPDWDPDYEGCTWTPDQVYDFVSGYGHLVTSTRLAAAESLNMGHRYYDALLNDETCIENFEIVAGHIYGGGLKSYPLAGEKGKAIWMTEHLLNEDYETDAWGETMTMVNEMNDCMTVGWNAYIWWYIKRYYSLLGDGEKGTAESAILPRGHAFAQFSRYVRPGYVRVKAVSKVVTVRCSAYKGDGKVVLVLINNGSSEQKDFRVGFGADMTDVSSASVICTSASSNAFSLPFESDTSTLTVDLPARSVTTVVI